MSDLKEVAIRLVTNPEVIQLAAVIILSILIKCKVVTEVEIAKAQKILKQSRATISEVTDKTKLTMVQVENAIGDKNSKKIQRGVRKILRGWLNF